MTNKLVAGVGQTAWDRAIVTGRSIAGLAAARVLSDYFREVIFGRARQIWHRGRKPARRTAGSPRSPS
jgi:hypothetical protein